MPKWHWEQHSPNHNQMGQPLFFFFPLNLAFQNSLMLATSTYYGLIPICIMQINKII